MRLRLNGFCIEGSEVTGAITCPNVILGNYSVDYEIPHTSSSAYNSTLDSCSNKTLMDFENSRTTLKLGYTAGSQMLCVYSVTSGGETYLHTINIDASVDKKATYRFTCWVLAYTSGKLQGTAYPMECHSGQTSTAVELGGQTFEFLPYYTCAPTTTDSGLAGWEIALIVLGILLAIVVIAFVAFVIKTRNQPTPFDRMEIMKDGSRQSTPDSLTDGLTKSQMELLRDDPRFGHFIKDRKEKERTFDLIEVHTDKKKPQDPVPVKEEPREPLEFPPGKKPIPPTTPRPEEDDNTLMRIKKERERKEKEREERRRKEQQTEELRKKLEVKEPEETVDPVIKHTRENESSEEYETDDSEKEERAQKLLEKRRRLADAAYKPPEGVAEGKVVGRKKRRKHEEGHVSDTPGGFLTREQQELQASKRRSRKKMMKQMAKNKLTQSDLEYSESETDTGSRRHKRRKKGEPRARGAPHMEKYIFKKDIEAELDDMDYWHEKERAPKPVDDIFDLDDTKTVQVAPADTGREGEEGSEEKRMENVLQDEESVWATYGVSGFRPGPNGELPEGFHFDEEGNVVRDADGKVIPKTAYEKQMEIRRRLKVFALPRLKRNTDGRPLGGYKDDEFGPTAEWDWGEPISAQETEEDKNQTAHVRPTSLRQVGFTTVEDRNDAQSPVSDDDFAHRKGRLPGSAERTLLKQRLFDETGKPIVDSTRPAFMPVYLTKGGVKPDSVYIDSAQIVRQELPARTQSQRPPVSGGFSMVSRSDTFNDGRSTKGKRRLSLVGSENIEAIRRERRNIGSDDEFFLVPGSLGQLNKPPTILDSQLDTNHCSRYNAHQASGRERTTVTDMSMRTAPDSTLPVDLNMRKYLEELYKDKQYFDKYVKTEKLPTNAGIETLELANHARGFLKERAEYWRDHLPETPAPPPTELGLRLSRMRTFNGDDSGLESGLISDRPLSADDVQVKSNLQPQQVTERSRSTGNSAMPTGERVPPTGRSPEPPVMKSERIKTDKTVTIDDTPREMTKEKAKLGGNITEDAKPAPKKKSVIGKEDVMLRNTVVTINEIDNEQ
ncbi:uncharacterized protein LOC127878252 [Dreissena polymorpha]|uniref:uncharacterized protein LOC127878252 n=1 Tax=Dreissena polymorpha TaxID=45954 RepID=UPI002264874D|nr:uncharacterized protein LOC127878252 [Dreissena polymorpha]